MKTKLRDMLKSRKLTLGIVFVLTFIVTYSILITNLAPKKYSLKEGEIAKENIKAPRDVEDAVATEEKKTEVAKAIDPVYTFKKNVKEEVIQEIDDLFSKTMEINNSNIGNIIIKELEENEDLTSEERAKLEEEHQALQQNAEEQEKVLKIEKLQKESKIHLSKENYETLLQLKINEMEDLRIFIEKAMVRLYDELQINEEEVIDLKKILDNDWVNEIGSANKETSKNDKIDKETEGDSRNYRIKLEHQINAQNFIENEFNKSDFSNRIKELGKSIGFSQIRANFVYDEEATIRLREKAIGSVEPVIIKKDQIIIKEGEPVTEAQIEVLRNLEFLDEKSSFRWVIYTSLGALVCLMIVLQWLYLYKYHRKVYMDTKKLILISIVNIISLILARTLSVISPFLIPLACAPMLITLLIDDDVSITISVLNCVLISAAVQFNLPITILALINSVIGVMLLKNMDQRSDILYSSLFISIINTIIALTLGFLQNNNNIIDVLTKSGVAFLSGAISGVLTIGFLPFFESSFDIVTTVKLLELSNPNQPLLKRLLVEAPGTYHHSVLVANLAELGAESVGANAVLARVAAYYHDVGKLKRPYFFKENQMGGENPHNKITPNLSTLIIISHVKDGIELAKEYKVPKVIRDVIQQHHGTSLVKYFYITMKNNSEKPEEVKEEDFKYSGPIPLSKEAGIIMLADGVEAAVRSISEPTKGKIEEMVNNIIKGRLNDGQLDNCDLTLKDLDKIREAFLKGLSGIYHERIEYPKLYGKSLEKNEVKDIKDIDNLIK